HSHQGSIGNLCLSEISEKKNRIIQEFRFEKIDEAIFGLLNSDGNE
ncbi:MAG: hypothetical protein GX792_04835, partial [Bacteroidales bacterium]|nr:hypothetical protein [Bacteroidales bacterium]